MQYDVVIIGAGLVGQAVAAALVKGMGNKAVRIALVDPSYNPDVPALTTSLQTVDIRVSALTAQTQEFLTQVGAWQHLPSAALSPYTGMHVWDAEGTGSVTFDAAELHVPCLGHIVENRQTLWALQQVVNAAESIDVFPVAVRYCDNPDSDGFVPVVLETGKTLNAKLVVGADGALSRARQWAGLSTNEWDYDHHAIVATVECEQSIAATAWQRFRPEGPLAFLPVAHHPHLASIVWSTSPAEAKEFLALDDEAFCQALSTAFEHRLGAVIAVSKRASFPLRQRHARDYFCRGIVLAGDAAHTIHPLAGQGVNLGFKDAAVLSEEIVRALKRGISPGTDAVLSRYQRRRQADNLATMAAMEGFKRLFAADMPMVRWLRNEGMRLFDRWLPVKQHVVMKAMGLDRL
ncbi:UbiH/UbiF/VisC/COQ6 family ubiquinone biosynthesis hydroxylase [Thalassolituus sp.]|jgi:2-octaprenylphenol hydroxylase|uniref:UbiH/UbiF/VisC/COQ6 family ubiquinone biosynthesis hydroxylase n=1 Tax=Thalassolituus sp. TaxID=2030822 RepID=UPI0032D99128